MARHALGTTRKACSCRQSSHRMPSVFEESALLCWIPRCDCCAGGKGAPAIWSHSERCQGVLSRLKPADHAAIARV